MLHKAIFFVDEDEEDDEDDFSKTEKRETRNPYHASRNAQPETSDQQQETGS